jgi:hypothetical protein
MRMRLSPRDPRRRERVTGDDSLEGGIENAIRRDSQVPGAALG